MEHVYRGLKSRSLLGPEFWGNLVPELGRGFATGVTGSSIYYFARSNTFARGFAMARARVPLMGSKGAAFAGLLYACTPLVSDSVRPEYGPPAAFLVGAAVVAAFFRGCGWRVVSCAAVCVGCYNASFNGS